MWLEGQGLQDCQRKIWQSPNEDSSNSQRERFLNDALCSVFFCSSSGLDEANPLCFLPGWKRDKSKNTLPSSSLGLLCFFNFFRFLWLSLSNEHDIWLEQRGAVFWIQNNDVERKKDWAQYTGKSSRGDVSRAALRAMDWPTLSSSYTLEDAKTRWGPRLVQTFLQNLAI